MYKHIIPVNMTDNGNLGNGMLKKRNCIEAGVFVFIIFILLKIAAMFFAVKTVFILGAIVGVAPTLFLVIGVGDNSIGETIITMLEYRKQKHVLHYSLAMCLKEKDEGKEKKKKKKLTKEEKAIEKARKKSEKSKKAKKTKKEKKGKKK